MTGGNPGRNSIRTLVPVLVGVLLGACALPRGHREGSVVFGVENLGPRAMLHGVEEGGLAHRAGLRNGDRVVRLNGNEVASRVDLRKISQSLSVGDKLEIEVHSPGQDEEETARREAVVTQADIGESANYIVYGYEKVGDKTKRRWLHLGLIAFGDWTGSLAQQGIRSQGVHVDVLPERVARGAALVAYMIPKAILVGLDRADVSTRFNMMLPTLFLGRNDENTFANALLFAGMWGKEGRVASLWPAAGLLQMGGNDGGLVYLTPFNSVGWGEETVSGVTLGGVASFGPMCRALLPLFSYVDPKG